MTTVFEKLNEALDRETTGVGIMPIPVSETLCGEAAALSTRVSAALSVPAAVGLKVTERVQVALTASALPQLLVCENDVGLVPVSVIVEIVSDALPVFLSVKVWTADEAPTVVEAKVRLVGVRLTAGTPTPVPVRVTVCGELEALSVKLSVAEKVPAAVGLKVPVAVQVLPGASDVEQVLVPWKSEA